MKSNMCECVIIGDLIDKGKFLTDFRCHCVILTTFEGVLEAFIGISGPILINMDQNRPLMYATLALALSQ